MKRSEFLKVMGLTAVGAAFAPSILANGKQTNNVSRIATDIKDLKANVNRPVTFLVLGAGNRGSVYAGYAKKYPDCMKIVGVADKNQLRLKSMAEDHDVPEENRFTDWKEALNKTKFADAVIISLPDKAVKNAFNSSLPIHANIEQTNVIIQLLSHKQDQKKHHYNLIRNKSK